MDGRQILRKGSSVNNALEIQIEYSNGYHHIHGTAGCGGSPCNVVDSEEIYTDVWYHVIFLRTSNNQLMLYLDSKLHDQKNYTNSNLNNSENLFIGYDPNYADEEFEGIIDTLIIWNRALSSEEISELYSLSRGPVAHWSFDGNADDVSGNEYHGTVDGATLTEDRHGNPDSAYYFDGNDEIVTNFTSLDSHFSIGAWIRKTNSLDDALANIVGNSNSQTGWWLHYREHSGDVGPGFEMHGKGGTSSNSPIELDVWHHLLFSFDGQTDRFYLDGQLVSSREDDPYSDSSTNFVKIGQKVKISQYCQD